MGLDDLPLAVESDVSIVPVDAQLSQLGHQVGDVKAHVMCILGSEMLFMSKGKNLSQVIPSDKSQILNFQMCLDIIF